MTWKMWVETSIIYEPMHDGVVFCSNKIRRDVILKHKSNTWNSISSFLYSGTVVEASQDNQTKGVQSTNSTISSPGFN